MTAFQPGEIVDVEIKGVRVASLAPVRDDGRDNPVIITDERGNLYALPPQAAITRVAPAEWPPQAGDLWRDASGCLLFARDLFEGDVSMAPEAGICDEETPARAWEIFGPLTLVHREEAPAEAPAEPDCVHLGRIHCKAPDCSCKTDDGEDL